jgi:hypothetical protein
MDMAMSSMARNSQNTSRSISKVNALQAKAPPDCLKTLESFFHGKRALESTKMP